MKLICLLLITGIATCDFLRGADDGASVETREPSAFDPARWPLDKAVENMTALKLYELERFERLHFQLRINLWYSIVDLERFIQDESKDPQLREGAKGQLVGIAKYFAEKPKEPLVPENPEVAKKIREQFEAAPKEGANDRNQIQRELHEGFAPLMGGLFDAIERFQAQAYARDLETQVIVDRINAEQAGTGQPATRPESKSEVSDKPQPEAEGRSR